MLQYLIRKFQCKLLFLISKALTLNVSVLQEFPRDSQVPHHPVLHMFISRRLQYLQSITEARCNFFQAFGYLNSTYLII